MHDELQAFFEAPNARTYRKVREALLDEVTLSAGVGASVLSTTSLAELAERFAHGSFAAVLERVDELQPYWALSPRVHYLAAIAAEELGDQEVAVLERFVFQACLEGILATGEGTADAPYLITYLSDEYDVLMALGVQPRSQAMVEHRGLLCDVVQGADGEEIWFELTGVVHDGRPRAVEFAVLQGLRR